MEDKIFVMLTEINKRFDVLEEKLMQEMHKQMEAMEKRILDRQFVFETEYGSKIDAIFEAVTLELDKNIDKSQKIGKLEGRMDRSEVTIFNHEKRISTLELRS